MTENTAHLDDISNPDAAYRAGAGRRVSTGPKRRFWPAFFSGWKNRCPRCGEGHIFSGYLAVAPKCSSCGCEFHHHQADDAPPYFTIFVVGHILVPLALALEEMAAPPLWVHWSLWIPLAIIMSLALLRPIKGALIGAQWAMRMHGFANARD